MSSNVTIQTGGTSNGAFADGVFTPTDADAVADADEIAATLSSGMDVTINTAGASGGQDGDITVASTITKSGASAPATLRLNADDDILVNPNVTIQQSGGTPGTDKLDIVLNADGDADGSGRIYLAAVSSSSRVIFTTNGGDVRLGGRANGLSDSNVGDASHYASGNTTNGAGVELVLASISTSGGAITMAGRGGAAAGTDVGVTMSGSTLNAAGGTIMLTGQGGASDASAGRGISIHGGSSLQTTSGNVVVTGTGGVTPFDNDGVLISRAFVTSQTTGAISVTGTGGSGTGNDDQGVVITDGATVSTVDGPITITGIAGAGGGVAQGIRVTQDAIISSSGLGAISLIGTGVGAGPGSEGIALNASRSGSNFSPDGLVSIRSTGGAAISLTSLGGDIALGSDDVFGGGRVAEIETSGAVSMIASGAAITLAGRATITGTAGVTLTAGNIALAGTVTSNGTVTLAPSTDAATIGVNDASKSFSISDAEIDLINAPAVTIGSATNTGGITVGTDGAVTAGAKNLTLVTGTTIAVNGAVSTTGSVALNAGTSITQTAAGVITASGLAATATAGSLDLTRAASNVTTFAANASGSVGLLESDGFQIGTSGVGVNGVTAGTNVQLESGGTISQTQAITAGGLAVRTNVGDISLASVTNSTKDVAFNTAGNASYKTSTDINVTTVAAVGTLASLSGATVGGTLALTTTGAGATITQTDGSEIVAANLGLLAGGSVTLTDHHNAVENLSARITGTGDFSYQGNRDPRGPALTIVNLPAVNATTSTGIQTADGAITINAGAFTINATVVTLDADLRSNGSGGAQSAILIDFAPVVLTSAGITIDTDSVVDFRPAGNVTLMNTVTSDIVGSRNFTVDASSGRAGVAGGQITFVGALGGAGTDALGVLTVLGNGVTFTGTNNVGTLAIALSGAGNGVSYTDADALTVGTGGGINGIMTNGGAVTLTAASITLNAAVSTTGAVALNATGGVSSSAGGTISAGSVTVTAGDSGTLNGSISGGSFTKEGAGTVTLAGTNTYSGTTTINAGTLRVVGGLAIPDLTGFPTGAVVLANVAGATLELINTETIGSLAGGGAAGGNVDLVANTLTTGGAGSTSYAGSISGTGGLTKAGSSTFTLTGANGYLGATTINAGTLLVDGSIAGSSTTVNNTGTLGGTGTVGAVTVQSGGILSPGNSPGVLDTGNLTLTAGAHLKAEIGGTTAGNGAGHYDQVNVTGTVNLAGATLVASLFGFDPETTSGATFTIIDNDLSDAVTGTFAGLAEGAHFTVGGSSFAITYHGGSNNNDVLLTALNDAPVLGGDGAIMVAEGGAVLITTADLTATDVDNTDTQLAFTVTGTTHGTVRLNGSATTTFTKADILAGHVSFQHDGGEADGGFAVSLSDGTSSVTGSVSATVNPHVNDAPVVSADTTLAAIDEDSGPRLITQGELLGHASDVDGPSLTAINLAIASGLGTLADNHNGTWSYTPAKDDDTQVTFSYQVTDGSTPVSSSAKMFINPVTDAPTVEHGTSGNDSFTAGAGAQAFDAGLGVDTINFGFKLTEATVTYDGNKVIIDGPSGSHTVLQGFEVFKFTDGTVNNADGSPLVDDLFYYSQYHDVWLARFEADLHYEIHGWKEGRDPNAFFDTEGYLANYGDVKAAGMNPLTHYDLHGWKEGRDPSSVFDTGDYLTNYPDVNAAKFDPLAHFLLHGAQEGRVPFNDGAWG